MSSADGDRSPLWYRDAVLYQLHVKAFADGDGDGVGDFAGLTGRLDYLASLGVTALWLLPFYPSPLRDDGYDIADYGGVNPAYGDLAAFRRFLREAHRRGLKVITELVINHTSDRHPWFQRARQAAPGTPMRNYYVWSDTPDRYREARVIFQDFETSNWAWDPVAQAYYWHRFYSHQPDLNFEEPAVRRAVIKAMDFWFKMGVDGMRLDAVPYLYEAEGTNCENLPQTHAFLKELRAHIDARFANRMLLAEANQWPEDARAYFGEGDECHMCFHFPVMPRLYMALHQEDRFPVIDILEQTPAIPETCQWATFLRNHDELTLEMVTDEDRDYMVRVYAADPRARINLGIRRRLAPLLANDRRRIELMNSLLFSLPGTPVIYYGDEIGMGDNIYLGDRDGVRTPMQWSPDRNAGFSRANPQKLYLPVIVDPEYHYAAINVEAQEGNPRSLLWWTRRLIAMRRRFAAFSRGGVEFLRPQNHRVLAFVRRHGDERVLVVANLSRFSQPVELDPRQAGGDLIGATPVELFGRIPFPRIGERPYPLTLGPYDFYWFVLEDDRTRVAAAAGAESAEPPRLQVTGSWERALAGPARSRVEEALPEFVRNRHWFAGSGRPLRGVRLVGTVALGPAGDGGDAVDCHVAAIDADYADGEPERYLLPLGFATGERGRRWAAVRPWSVVARLVAGGRDGILFDATCEPAFWRTMLAAIARRRRLGGNGAALIAASTPAFRTAAAGRAPESLIPALAASAEGDTEVVFGGIFRLRLFRRLEAGIHPDLELARFLTAQAGYPQTAAVAGVVDFEIGEEEAATAAILRTYDETQGDAWSLTVDALGRFFERVVTGQAGSTGLRPPTLTGESLGAYAEWARLLGERVAGLHRALGSGEDEAFLPAAFSTLYQRSLYQSMRAAAARTLDALERRRSDLPKATSAAAGELLAGRRELLSRFEALRRERFDGARIRIHGDLRLDRWLWTGRDFLVADFVGDPARPLTERRIKRSPLVDVAGMLLSLRAATHAALDRQGATGFGVAGSGRALERWAGAWFREAEAAFLGGYLQAAAGWTALPADRERLAALLAVFRLRAAIAELDGRLGGGAGTIRVALRDVLDLMEKR